MPCVLTAAGLEEEAIQLKGMSPIICRKSLVSACRKLNQLCKTRGMDKFWASLVKDAKFWCEAAIWAAAEGDENAFKANVEQLILVMQNGMPAVDMH
jgi:hypothetical protein